MYCTPNWIEILKYVCYHLDNYNFNIPAMVVLWIYLSLIFFPLLYDMHGHYFPLEFYDCDC